MQTKNINQDMQAAQNASERENSHVLENQKMEEKNITPSSTPFLGKITSTRHQFGSGRLISDDSDHVSVTCSNEIKPALPPKPTKVPPPYRAPPRPPVPAFGFRPSTAPPERTRTMSALPGSPEDPGYSKEESNHRDSYMATSTATLRDQVSSTNRIPTLSQAFRLQKLRSGTPVKDTGRQVARTQAWVQEQKAVSKPVGERFVSLQQRLRSLLNHSPTGRSTNDQQKQTQRIDTEEHSALFNGTVNLPTERGLDNPGLSLSTHELRSMSLPARAVSDQAREKPESHFQQRETQDLYDLQNIDQNLGESSVVARPQIYSETDVNKSEENMNTENLRDACSKLFGGERTTYWSNCITANHTYINMGHNFNSSYDYEKVVPKESIGKPSQERKSSFDNVVVPHESSARGVFELLPRNSKIVKQYSTHWNLEHPTTDGEGFRTKYSTMDSSHPYLKDTYEKSSSNLDETDPKSKLTDGRTGSTSCSPYVRTTGLQGNRRSSEGRLHRDEVVTPSDQYKSSSESGRGTLRSGSHSLKSPASVKSRTPSEGSVLDTSIDSDHSAGVVRWPNKTMTVPPYEDCREATATLDTEALQWSDSVETEMKDIFNKSKPSTLYRKEETTHEVGLGADGTCSESMSVTPPLPPLSPPESPTLTQKSSPQVLPKTKYKLSSSATALNVTSITDFRNRKDQLEGKNYCHDLTATMTSGKGVPAKKTGIRRTASITQGSFKHWDTHTKHAVASRSVIGNTNSHQRTQQYQLNGSSQPATHSEVIRSAAGSIHGLTSYTDPIDAEVTSTTTGLDMESLLEDPDDYSSEVSATTSNVENNDVGLIRKQLDGLETMYSEVLRLLGLKHNNKRVLNSRSGANDGLRSTRRRIHGSLSSLTGRSSVSRGTHSFKERRSQEQRRRMKESRIGAPNKRLQRLESHVVTLARSVAHLSSEMRTQQVLVQELEALRQDVNWLQEQLRAIELSAGNVVIDCPGARASRGQHSREREKFRRDFLELNNPGRIQKLTKFFGDEPPLLRQFLKKLGYEKYAASFEGEKIGIMELPYLTEERLQKIGIPMGPRMRILQEAQMSFRQDQFNIYIV
ncbi:uncharacterized protein LOC143251897 [Tachypleus tridentatus]|uniref:uncharacterized protein LOC143251897 n=1 Tax=Tachypleus tridentatus TaxID=6853 RepID=UPI003FD55689